MYNNPLSKYRLHPNLIMVDAAAGQHVMSALIESFRMAAETACDVQLTFNNANFLIRKDKVHKFLNSLLDSKNHITQPHTTQ